MHITLELDLGSCLRCRCSAICTTPSSNRRTCVYQLSACSTPSFDTQIDVHLVPELRDENGIDGYYNPIIFPNEFWHTRSQYVEINDTTAIVPLQVVFQPMSYFKFQMFASMTFGFEEAVKQKGGGSTAEMDEVKRMLIETNPWFLALTGIVSVLHVV